MPQAERSKLETLLEELCRAPMGKQKLVEAFEDAYARENAQAAECAKAALFEPSKAPLACAVMGRVHYIADILSVLARL